MGGPRNDWGRAFHAHDAQIADKQARVLLRFAEEYILPLRTEIAELRNEVEFLRMPWRYRVYYSIIYKPWVQAVLRPFKRKHDDTGAGSGVESGEADAGAPRSGGGDAGSQLGGAEADIGAPPDAA